MPLTAYMNQQIAFHTRYDNGNWWVWFKDAWVGYFPGSIWQGQFTSGDMSHYYGEVYSANNLNPPRTAMGSGVNPFVDWMSSADMVMMCQYSTTNDCRSLTTANVYMTNQNYYGAQFYYSAPSWNKLIFGGPGQ
jgi:hypothetical protein